MACPGVPLVGQLDAAAGPSDALAPEERKGAVAAFHCVPGRDPERMVSDMCWQPITTLTDRAGRDCYRPDAAVADDEVIAH